MAGRGYAERSTIAGAYARILKLEAGTINLSADQTWTGRNVFRVAQVERSSTDGTIVAKALGDGKGGVHDLSNDDTVGFIYHLHTGPNSGSQVAAIGVGTDDGLGSGVLISHKNAGRGLRVIHNPTATGDGVGITAYNKTAWPLRFDGYVGNLGVVLAAMPGEGFNNGQIRSDNLSKLYVPGANFTGADVGLTVSQTTSTGRSLTGPSAGALVDAIVIPSGTTIASIVDTDSVLLSQPATGPVNGTNIFVGRPVVSGQNLIRFFDNATQIGSITRSQGQFKIPMETMSTTGSNPNSIFADGSQNRHYIYNGSNYNRSDFGGDANGFVIRAYAAAAKGSEASPVTLISGRPGSGGQLGFFGSTPASKQTLTAAATDATSTQALANSLRTAIINLGLGS